MIFVYPLIASRVFDESDDECDEDNAESIRVICELKEKIEPTPKMRVKTTRLVNTIPNRAASTPPKGQIAVPSTSTGPGRVTRSAGHFNDLMLDDLDEELCTTEMLLDEQESEYIISECTEYDDIEEFTMAEMKVIVENGDQVICLSTGDPTGMDEITEVITDDNPDDIADDNPDDIAEETPEDITEDITEEMHEESNTEEVDDVVIECEDGMDELLPFTMNQFR